MNHSWAGYTQYAWGYDELLPLSKTGENSFCGLGATIIDSLDTLWCHSCPQHTHQCTAIKPPPPTCVDSTHARCNASDGGCMLHMLTPARQCHVPRLMGMKDDFARARDWVASELSLNKCGASCPCKSYWSTFVLPLTVNVAGA